LILSLTVAVDLGLACAHFFLGFLFFRRETSGLLVRTAGRGVIFSPSREGTQRPSVTGPKRKTARESDMQASISAVLGTVALCMGCGEMDSSDGTGALVVDQDALFQHARAGGDDRGGGDNGGNDVGGGGDAGSRARVRCPKSVPAALNPPADATIKLALSAKGVQIYTCAVAAAGGAPAWTLKAPHAVLDSGAGAPAAIHFAGPSWQALDGSLVTGTRTASAPAPLATAIPWLMLQAATNVGPGLFNDVTWVQRLDTVAGAAPATGCDDAHVGAQVLIPYRASYVFYQKATSAHVHQCASK
jgi:hypothetical protein